MNSILVIDDDSAILSVLQQMLEGAGYHVFVATDGREGEALYRDNKIDLLITDMIMPEQEGLQTIRSLKKDFPDIKVIAMSGGGINDGSGYLDLAKHMGASSVLSKPIRIAELLQAVKDVLGE